MILLIIMGPIYLLEAIIQLFSGKGFFREKGNGNGWIEQIISSFDQSQTDTPPNFNADIGLIVSGLIGFLLLSVGRAAIIFALNHIRNGEDYTIRSLIKQSFSRFWPMLGSNIIFGLIVTGMTIIPIFIVSLTGVFGSMVNPILGILLAIVLFLGFAVGIGLLLTRWSFYFGAVVLDRDAPGISRSWSLTKNRTWILMGLYIVFYFIISAVSMAVQMSAGIFLGDSVLLYIITNLVTIITTIFFSVGYGVMYLDLKIRHDAEDLKEMIDDYQTKTL
jgi:hypothetical protein